MELVIGTRRWSTWSLRPWLAMRRAGLAFTERLVRLRSPATAEQIAAVSPSGRVPVLIDEAVTIWDSLAICEYAAELRPEAQLWPRAPEIRALARAAVAEMHSGFAALRTECPMDLLATPTAGTLSDAAASDVRRIIALWRALRAQRVADGPHLLGAWTIADAFFTPVASRFHTYRVDLAAHGDDGEAAAYTRTALASGDLAEWIARAAQEEA